MQDVALSIVRCFARLPTICLTSMVLLGSLRADDRLTVRHHRGEAAHEDGREFRNVVALRAFLDVLQIIEPEAEDLARPRDRQPEFKARQRAMRRRGCALR